jgi:hypothetical protein
MRVNRRLTLNLGLRYEYATPLWEARNVLSNYDPISNTMIGAKDGSIADRALVNPDRNNFGPRLGFAYSASASTIIRGGWGMSYVHVNRIGSANLLAINAPGRARRGESGRCDKPVIPSDRTGLSSRPDRSIAVQSGDSAVSYIDPDFHSSPVQSWSVSACSNSARGSYSTWHVGNKADDLLYLANYNQAAVQPTPTSTPSLAARRPIPTFGDITYVFNGESRAQGAAGERRVARTRLKLPLPHGVRSQGQRRGRPREPERQFPGPDFKNMHLPGLPSAAQQHDELRLDAAVRPRPALGSGLAAAFDAIAGGWQHPGSTR